MHIQHPVLYVVLPIIITYTLRFALLVEELLIQPQEYYWGQAQKCLVVLRSGVCAGHSGSSSTLTLAHLDFMELGA